MAQRTIVLEYNGQKIVSNPFTFKHACIIDDERYKHTKENPGAEVTDGLINGWGLLAVQKMFEGTVITDEILENEINIKTLRKLCVKVMNWYFGVDEEIKNSSSLPAEETETPKVGG